MKKLIAVALLSGCSLAHAGGGYYNNYNTTNYSGWAPFVGGAIVGGVIVNALRPSYPAPPVVYYPAPVAIPIIPAPQQYYAPPPVIVPQPRCEIQQWQDQYGRWNQRTFCFNQ